MQHYTSEGQLHCDSSYNMILFVTFFVKNNVYIVFMYNAKFVLVLNTLGLHPCLHLLHSNTFS